MESQERHASTVVEALSEPVTRGTLKSEIPSQQPVKVPTATNDEILDAVYSDFFLPWSTTLVFSLSFPDDMSVFTQIQGKSQLHRPVPETSFDAFA